MSFLVWAESDRKDFVEFFGRAADPRATRRHHHGALHENGVGAKRIEDLVVGLGRIIQRQVFEGCPLATQNITGLHGQAFEKILHLLPGWGHLEVFYDVRLVAQFLEAGEHRAGRAAVRIVVDCNAHRAPVSDR